MIKIAINGFGRIGRLFLRQAIKDVGISVVAINDLGDIENLAYLFKYDTVYGAYDGGIDIDPEKKTLTIEGNEIKVFGERDPLKLPWGKLEVDIVVESTGVFNSFEKAKAHVDAGAKFAIITAPSKDDDGEIGKTVLMGINEKDLKGVSVFSNGSCTTNASAPVVKILSDTIGIEKAVLTTTHAYTATQSIVDSPVRGNDFRKGRAGAQSMIPSSTGAAKTVERVMPEMKGKFDGIAIRVPVVSGSLADITFVSKKKTSVEEVNEILKKASEDPRWKGILKVTDEQIVSSDIIGEPYGAIVDLNCTRVVDGTLVKVFAWYDNEWGYVSTLLKHVKRIKV